MRILLRGDMGERFIFECDDVVDGVPVNPKLPGNFDSLANQARPARQRAWWGVPFILTYKDNHPKFLEVWKCGVRYDVRCLDGGAWDRSTWWGAGVSLEAAVAIAQGGPIWTRPEVAA
jgi:hypothetical protein